MTSWQLFFIMAAIYSAPHVPIRAANWLAWSFIALGVVLAILEFLMAVGVLRP